MTKAINDDTQKQIGLIYQYLVALKDCFELNYNETLQIEKNGDVSVFDDVGGVFQKEVKHHLGNQNLTERNIDFWKTLANWYTDYERIKSFSQCILSTTAHISSDSKFYGWNNLVKEDKLERITSIGEIEKRAEKNFRRHYNRIFNDSFNEKHILEILEKFIIFESQTSIVGISNNFIKYLGHIPPDNRDQYIGAILGEILIMVKDEPHIWEVTREKFELILQKQTGAYGTKGSIPLPREFNKAVIPNENIDALKQKKFVESIREIEYENMITEAITDYWKADLTICRYFQDNPMYLESLEEYQDELIKKMKYEKSDSEINAEESNKREKIKISKMLYNCVMKWDANDFGSIIHNQGYFQRGVIHNIVDETDFSWRVGIGVL
jgi:hypothetical protein